jgi:hypothetical protein
VKWTSWVSFAGLAVIMGIVVYTSFDVGTVRCEVCMAFEGDRACRAVDGASADEAKRAAVTNACALLASGVTRTMACERTPPESEHCDAR